MLDDEKVLVSEMLLLLLLLFEFDIDAHFDLQLPKLMKAVFSAILNDD